MKEVMIYAMHGKRGKWEFATQEANFWTGKTQWIRRDGSWICNVGDEIAIHPVPDKPKRKTTA